MNTVLDHLTDALDALDAEIARITEARNDTAALIEQLRPTAAAPVRPVSPPPTRKAARTGPPARPKPTRTGPAAQARVDYPAIAREIIALRSEGKAVRPELAARHNVPPTTVANWITKCTQLGLLANDQPPATTPSSFGDADQGLRAL